MLKKLHKKTSKTLISTQHLLKFGNIGFKSISRGLLTKEQIFSIESSLNKKIKTLTLSSKNIKSWSFLQTNKTLTKLNLESRMGKGKGAIFTESIFIKPGFVIYEFQNITLNNSLELFNFIQKQIPINLILVKQKNTFL